MKPFNVDNDIFDNLSRQIQAIDGEIDSCSAKNNAEGNFWMITIFATMKDFPNEYAVYCFMNRRGVEKSGEFTLINSEYIPHVNGYQFAKNVQLNTWRHRASF